jgi:hypothetical protein
MRRTINMDIAEEVNARKSFMLIALYVVKDGIPYPKILSVGDWKIDTMRVLHAYSDLHPFDDSFVSDERFAAYVRELKSLGLVVKDRDGDYQLTEAGRIYTVDTFISNGIYLKEVKRG